MVQPPDADRTLDLSAYAGRWVALLGKRVVGQGGTADEALLAAKVLRFKETPKIVYVSMNVPLTFGPLLELVVTALPLDSPVYLVGGVVRDALLGRLSHDWDFVVPAKAIQLARRLANTLSAAFYPMDEAHDTARLILIGAGGERFFLDFTSFRGSSLEEDLRARDTTVNAMAVDIRQPAILIDPLGGAADLHAKRLRACSPSSFSDDPLRLMRAVRQAASYQLRIIPETRELMRAAVPGLVRISPERVRDELFKMLDGPKPDVAIRALELLGVLDIILPELAGLRGVEQSAPHVYNVWEHTLAMLQKLDATLAALALAYDEEKAANLAMGLAVMQLGRFRAKIGEHLGRALNPDRGLRPLLFLAALYHDIAKPDTKSIDGSGRTRFFDHERWGARVAAERGRALRLSNVEIDRLQAMVRYHMRPFFLSKGGAPTPKAVYRFFRDAGPAGVDVCLLSLADFLATYGADLPQEMWGEHLEVVRLLLAAWWEHPEKQVRPPALINGNDLRQHLSVPAGPLIGELLEKIREAQAEGRVNSAEQALALAKSLFDKKSGHSAEK